MRVHLSSRYCTLIIVVTIFYYNSHYYNRVSRDIHFAFASSVIHLGRKRRIIIVCEIPVFRCQDLRARLRGTSALAKFSPYRGRGRKPVCVRRVERASVSERKHIKDGALLKEERGKKGKQRREQAALFPASCLSFWFRVLCVHS